MTDRTSQPNGYEDIGPCTYFITFDDHVLRHRYPMMKIGITTDLRKRLASLSTASPFRLIAAGIIQNPPNPVNLEEHLHKSFTDNRVNGEWFNVTPDMIEVVREHDVLHDRFDELFSFAEGVEIEE